MALPIAINSLEEGLAAIRKSTPGLTEKAGAMIFPKLAGSVPVNTSVVSEKLSLNALLFLHSPFRYTWYCAGVGTGKSYVLARYVLRRVMENPETVGLLAANSFTQLAQSTLPHLYELLDETGLEYKVNCRPPESWGASNKFRGGYKNVISIKVGEGKVAHILTRTLLGWKKIRGVTIGWAGIDEIADTVIDAWKEINERLRCDKSHRLQIMVAGMPAFPGDNWTWEVFNPKDPESQGMFRVIFQSSVEAAHLSWKNYLLPLLKTLDPLQALQRVHARIVINQTGKVYYSYRDQINNVLKYKYDPKKTIHACWDFNILSNAPIALVLFQEHWNYELQHWEIQVFDEIVLPGETTLEACYEFLKRYERHEGEVWVYGDATSNLNRTVTEFRHIRRTWKPTFMARLKMVQIDKKSNPRIEFRVTAMNGMLRNSLDQPRLFVCPDKCPETIKDFKALKPKDGKIVKDDDARSHATDGLGYGVCVRFPPILEKKQKQQKVNL